MKDVKSYVKRCDIWLALKVVRYKPYNDLQFLLILTHQWKDLMIDFVTGLMLFTDWKGNNYNLILVIVNYLTKIVHYKLAKVTIDTPRLGKVIIDMVVWHYGLPDSIINDRRAIFTSMLWSSLSYFLDIKTQLSTAFHVQIDRQMEEQNSIMEAYFQAFVNFKQYDWAKHLSMAEFAYNHAKNAITSRIFFKLNCGYHP